MNIFKKYVYLFMFLLVSDFNYADSKIDSILKQNTDDILTPEGISEINENWKKVNIGYKYKRVLENLSDKSSINTYLMILKKIDQDKFIFEFFYNEELISNPVHIYIGGIEHKSYSGKIEGNSELYGECKFVLGKCNQKITKTKSREINTRFESGKWIRSYKGHGGSTAKSVTIYNKLGLELYRYYHAKK